MKMFLVLVLIFYFVFSSNAQKATLTNQSILYVDSVKIPYNNKERIFKIKVMKAKLQQGYWISDVEVVYGPNQAKTKVTFPKSRTAKVLPFVKKDLATMAYNIGFQIKGSTVFYPYFLVKAGKDWTIETKYIKAYQLK